MTQTEKGNRWFYDKKVLIGIDAECALIHTLEGKADKVSEIAMMKKCAHKEEATARGEGACYKKNLTIEAFVKEANLSVLIPTKKPVGGALSGFFVKVRYRGSAKNAWQFVTRFALATLGMARKRVLPMLGEVRM